MNQIINGVNTLSANLVGKSVVDVRTMLSQALNIDPQARPLVNGADADASYILQDGDELEFVKAAGEKGC
jgi:hypothetical protein